LSAAETYLSDYERDGLFLRQDYKSVLLLYKLRELLIAEFLVDYFLNGSLR